MQHLQDTLYLQLGESIRDYVLEVARTDFGSLLTVSTPAGCPPLRVEPTACLNMSLNMSLIAMVQNQRIFQ